MNNQKTLIITSLEDFGNIKSFEVTSDGNFTPLILSENNLDTNIVKDIGINNIEKTFTEKELLQIIEESTPKNLSEEDLTEFYITNDFAKSPEHALEENTNKINQHNESYFDELHLIGPNEENNEISESIIETEKLTTSSVKDFITIEKNVLESQLIETISSFINYEINILDNSPIQSINELKEIEEIHQKLLFIMEEGNILSEKAFLNIGYFYFLSYRYYEGIKLIEFNIKRFKQKDLFYNLLGNFYYKIGIEDKAIKYFKMTIRSTKSLKAQHFSLAYIYFQKNNFNKSLQHLKLAENYYLDNPTFLKLMGNCYEENQLDEKALFYYEKFISMEHDSNILQKLAHCTYKLKLADKAINYIERSLEFDINIKAHNYKMATCYFLLGQLDQAIIQMKELLNITDNLHNEKPYNLLLDLFLKAFKLGIYDSHTFYIFELFTKKLGIIYKDFLEKEININDIKDTEILFDLAKHTLAQKKYLTSSIFLKKILKVNKNHLFALQLLGKIYYNYSKTKEKGIKIFFLLEKKNKTDGEIDFYLGLNYYENGDYKHSLKLFKQSKEKNYSNYKLFEKLGECYLQLNKKQFAIKYFARAINMESNNPELHLKLGKLYLEKKEYQKAIKYFKKTTKLDKDNKEAHLHLSTTYKLILNHESENHYSKYLNLN